MLCCVTPEARSWFHIAGWQRSRTVGRKEEVVPKPIPSAPNLKVKRIEKL